MGGRADGRADGHVCAKHSDYEMVIYSVHLPPENCGRNATDFYSHLLGQSKKVGNDQESIQSSIQSDPVYFTIR